MIENSLALKHNNITNFKKDDYLSYTIVEINNKLYGISTFEVLEIMKLIEMDIPSALPSCILGMIKYNSNPVGVLDLREIFKEERKIYDLTSKIIILKSKKMQQISCALICDDVLDIIRIKKNEIKKIPYKDFNNFFEGVIIKNNQNINKQDNIYLLKFENVLNYIVKNLDIFKNDGKKYIVNDEKSIQILKKRKNFLMKVEQDTTAIAPLFDIGIGFVVNNTKYYINMASVREFFKVNKTKFTKVPNTPEYIYGLINVKGEYITVIDIRNFFNNEKSSLKEKSTIIILNSDEFKIGILVDEICESLNINLDEIIKNKAQKQEEQKTLEFVKNGEIYQVIDIQQLLKDERLTIC